MAETRQLLESADAEQPVVHGMAPKEGFGKGVR